MRKHKYNPLLKFDRELFNDVELYLDTTYSELITLINSNGLIIGQHYKITDYKTIYMQPVTGLIMEGNEEPIIVEAISENTISPLAYSESYPNHIIYYDINKNVVLSSEELEGEWNKGGDSGYDLTISNVTQNSFVVNAVVYPNSAGFNLYVEDSLNSYDLYAADLGTSFTVTDLGDGTSRIDLLVAIDLTDPVTNYAWIWTLVSRASRKGYITYRRDTERNFSKGYDFLNVKYRRYLIDSVAMNWGSSVSYAKGDHVVYNSNLYISLSAANLNNLPTNVTYWLLVTSAVTDKYLLTGEATSYGLEKGIIHDTLSFKDFYCYSVVDTISGEVSFNTSLLIKDIEDCEFDYLDNNVQVSLSNNIKDFSDNFFSGKSNNNTFWNEIVQKSEFKTFCNNICSDGTINLCRFSASGNNEFTNVTTCNFDFGFSFNVVKFMQSVNVGSNGTKNIFYYTYNSIIGWGFANNLLLQNFYDNNIGAGFTLNSIKDLFYGNIIGAGFSNNTINSDFFRNNIVGEFTGNTITNFNFKYNHIVGKFYNNDLTPGSEFDFANNLISADFYTNTLNAHFYRNTIASLFFSNTLSYFQSNIINDQFSGNTATATIARCTFNAVFVGNTTNEIQNCIFNKTFSSNILSSPVTRLELWGDVSGINFTGSTIIYGFYAKKITENSSTALIIEYLNASNVPVYAAITT
jgi:hypothetical protein